MFPRYSSALTSMFLEAPKGFVCRQICRVEGGDQSSRAPHDTHKFLEGTEPLTRRLPGVSGSRGCRYWVLYYMVSGAAQGGTSCHFSSC